jgi:hypothetical protein
MWLIQIGHVAKIGSKQMPFTFESIKVQTRKYSSKAKAEMFLFLHFVIM